MLPYQNEIAVAAHRGNSRYYPENTMVAYRSALELNVDMIEMDVHMTRDGELICMHDRKVDRTTNGTGLVCELTLEEIRSLDAGGWKDEAFAGEKVPLFAEFLELMSRYPNVMMNVELKDYPADCGENAYEAARKAISMLEAYDMLKRTTINTWSGELNEWISAFYGEKVMIHAYFPQTLMGRRQKRFVLDYAYCVCLFGSAQQPVVDKKHFDMVRAYGVEPWVYYPVESEQVYEAAVLNGARLFTANDPAWALTYLRSKNLHK